MRRQGAVAGGGGSGVAHSGAIGAQLVWGGWGGGRHVRCAWRCGGWLVVALGLLYSVGHHVHERDRGQQGTRRLLRGGLASTFPVSNSLHDRYLLSARYTPHN